ncbi:MAG: DUF5666 domain-containing protein [Gammaproteobacteria bacterium]
MGPAIHAEAIVGSGKQAIVGSGGNAIVGSGGNAIVGSGKQAIVGSGGNAIVGSGGNAIVGSGGNAIVGSGGNAIVGSGKQAIVGSGGNAIVGSGKSGFPNDAFFGPAISGPVEKIDQRTGQVTVLGRPVVFSAATRFATEDSRSPQVGDWVFVTGAASDGAVYASVFSKSSEVFVPGVSKVFLSGPVTELDLSTASMKIGGASVSFVSAETGSLRVGDFVEISGSQAQAGQTITTDVIGSSGD